MSFINLLLVLLYGFAGRVAPWIFMVFLQLMGVYFCVVFCDYKSSVCCNYYSVVCLMDSAGPNDVLVLEALKKFSTCLKLNYQQMLLVNRIKLQNVTNYVQTKIMIVD